MTPSHYVLALGLCLTAAAPPEAGQPAAPEPSVAASPTTLTLDGTLVPVETAAIALWPERYREELLVLEAVANGTYVNAGDVLIRFDTSKIDDQVRQEEFDTEQAKQKLARSEDEGRIQQEVSQAELARAQREAEWAARRLEGYTEKEKGFTQEGLRLGEQQQQYWIDDQRDELDQLEKMYREDELVDATEEIVLKRSRRNLASTVARASLSRQQNEYTLALPEKIKYEGLELDATQKHAALERQQRTATLARAAQEDSIARARFDLKKQQENLDQLKRDRQLFAVRAPRAGILLHGDSEAAPGSATLERGSRPALFKTIMTIADPDKLKVLVSVPEPSLGDVPDGTAAKVKVAAVPRFDALGRLELATLPTSRGAEGQNLYRAEIALESRDPKLRPGMRAKVTIEVTQQNVLAAPAPATREVR